MLLCRQGLVVFCTGMHMCRQRAWLYAADHNPMLPLPLLLPLLLQGVKTGVCVYGTSAQVHRLHPGQGMLAFRTASNGPLGGC
jgi:hypothetical protein